MNNRRKKSNVILVLLVLLMATVFMFAGCRDITEILQAEVIRDGALTEDEFNIITAPPDRSLTIHDPTVGEGTLVSLGMSVHGNTFFIDAVNGNDNFNGRTPLTPWRSFRPANETIFQPGDHILLEANSVWNGTPVSPSNLNTLLNSSEVGMLWPKGSGAPGRHIVIDFYRMEGFRTEEPTVYFRSYTRPVINGNGTPSIGSNRWFPSGAITLWEQHHWRIRNMQLTNSFKDILVERDTHWFDTHVPKHLCGIFIGGNKNTMTDMDFRQPVDPDDVTTYNIIVEYNFVHDVQSMHQNNGRGGAFQASQYLGGGAASPVFKVVGGIIVYGVHFTPDGVAVPGSGDFFGYNGMLLQHNIVKRVGLEGLRNKTTPDMRGWGNSNVVFRGNYLEWIFGDGIVLDGVQDSDALNARGNHMNGLIESNIVMFANAAPNHATANYAAVWSMTNRDSTFQFNEVFGTLYGWNDGEAWDIDIGSNRVIYQFNYSHHNSGGVILFMSGITNGIFRYNVSANDGGGTRWLANNVYPFINRNAESFTRWHRGQCLFHYTIGHQFSDNRIPLIYNNTFFIGDGIYVGVFGNDNNTPVNRYVRFFNNILLKHGSGTVFLSYGQQGFGHPGFVFNPDTGFRNNILWAVGLDGNPRLDAFNNGSAGMAPILGEIVGGAFEGRNDNRWVDPRLRILEEAGALARLQAQAQNTNLPDTAIINPEVLKQFTSRERLRARAGLLTPIEGSPAFEAGMHIPVTNMTNNSEHESIDRAWNTAQPLTHDMFGSPINWQSPPIGAAAATYRGVHEIP